MSHSIFGRACVFALGAALCVAPGAFAQDAAGDDIQALKDRITALEAKVDGSAAGGITAGIDKRPFIQSADGKSRIEFGGRIQARYTYQARDAAHGRDSSDRSFGELERARIRVEGTLIDPRFKFRLEWDGDTDSESLGLTDAYLQYVHKNKERNYTASVGAGQWKPFFGRQEQQSSAQQLLVDRSLANEFFNIDRNVGIWVDFAKPINDDGLMNEFRTQLAVSNGVDSVNKSPGDGEFDHTPAFIAHVDLDVMGKMGKYALAGGDYQRLDKPGLTVGASFVSDANTGAGGADREFVEYKLYQMAYDFVFKYAGFSLNGEYFGRWLDYKGADTASGNGVKDAIFSHGAYVEAGYMISDTKLQVVGRGSAVWNREGAATGNAVEAGGGVNYFFNQHNLKWSLDVLYLDIPADMVTMTEKLPGLGGSVHDFNANGNAFSDASFSSSSANLEEFQGVMMRTQIQIYF